MIFINFKTYQEGTGEAAVRLASLIEHVATATQHKVIPVVQPSDLKEITRSCRLEVWSQKIDPIEFGAHTGGILPEAVVEDGAVGTFINHSEAKISDREVLVKVHTRAREVGLKTLVFAQNLTELKEILTLQPTYAAYEPPELIGSKTTSVSTAQPEIILQAAEITKNAGIPLIVGAGVNSADDVRISLQNGAIGVALATDVVKAASPAKELLDLISGFE